MREKETAVRDRYTVMITLLCTACLALLILIAFALSKPEEEQKFFPNYAVSRAWALHAWNKAQQLKQDA